MMQLEKCLGSSSLSCPPLLDWAGWSLFELGRAGLGQDDRECRWSSNSSSRKLKLHDAITSHFFIHIYPIQLRTFHSRPLYIIGRALSLFRPNRAKKDEDIPQSRSHPQSRNSGASRSRTATATTTTTTTITTQSQPTKPKIERQQIKHRSHLNRRPRCASPLSRLHALVEETHLG